MSLRNKAGKKTVSYQLARQGYQIVRGRELDRSEGLNALMPDGMYVVKSSFCPCITGKYGSIIGRLLDYDESEEGNTVRVSANQKEVSRFVRAAARCNVKGSRFIIKR